MPSREKGGDRSVPIHSDQTLSAPPPSSSAGPSTPTPASRTQLDLLDVHPDEAHDENPPGYTEISPALLSTASLPTATASPWRHKLSTTPGIPPIDILAYLPSNATLSADHQTVTISDAKLCSDPAALTVFIQQQAALPPRPQIRITGHSVGMAHDFDMRLDLQRYFLRPRTAGPAWNYVKLLEKGEMGYRGETSETVKPHVAGTHEWARRFCKQPSAAGNKVFELERLWPNWNTALLEGRIRNLLASLRYQGKVEISFGATHTRVVVQPPPAGLIPRFLSFLSAPKKYAVVKSVWPYANMSAEDRGGARRECAVQTEDEWWEVWSGVIAMAVMARRKGWVTTEDVLDMAMCYKNQPNMSGMSWG